jgi:hypothetical protein
MVNPIFIFHTNTNSIFIYKLLFLHSYIRINFKKIKNYVFKMKMITNLSDIISLLSLSLSLSLGKWLLARKTGTS